MYLLNEETAKELKAINERIHNFDELGMFLENVFVFEPITSIMDEEYLENKLYDAIETKSIVRRLHKNYSDISYVNNQLIMYTNELNIIRDNLKLTIKKKSVECAFGVAFGVSEITWEDFELLYTEYHKEIISLETVSDEKLKEMYYVVLGRPVMTMQEFLSHCTAHGGDWCSMLLSGIEKCYPGDYVRLKAECDTINSNSGAEEFCILCDFLLTCITDWEELK